MDRLELSVKHKVLISGKLRFTEINKTIDPISIFCDTFNRIDQIIICSDQYEFLLCEHQFGIQFVEFVPIKRSLSRLTGNF